jgi:hypothetical protein
VTASATMTTSGEIELAFPYSPELVEALKQTIPFRNRKWDPAGKTWRVLGAYGPAAIDLLLAHFPTAEIPGDRIPRASASVAREDPTRVPLPPLPPLIAEVSTEVDQPELDHLVASVRCPRCHTRHEQPIRIVAETSRRVAKREKTPPEMVSVCPTCNTLAVVAFLPSIPDGAPPS